MPTEEDRSVAETPLQPMRSDRLAADAPLLPETPVQPVEAAHPVEPVQQGTPMMPLQPAHRMEALPRQDGVAPLRPMQSGRRVEGTPLQPMQSGRLEEGAPLLPETPVDPVEPAQRGTPVSPLQPTRSDRLAADAPLLPETADQPAQQRRPVTPLQPTQRIPATPGAGSAGGKGGGVTRIDTDSMKSAGGGLLNIQGRLAGIHSNLTDRLAAAGNAWGDDETGNSFYEQYGPSSTKELQGLQSAPQAVGDTYNGVMTMAKGFEGTEEQNKATIKSGPGRSGDSGYYGGHGGER